VTLPREAIAYHEAGHAVRRSLAELGPGGPDRTTRSNSGSSLQGAHRPGADDSRPALAITATLGDGIMTDKSPTTNPPNVLPFEKAYLFPSYF
jgi:hypothetical protein